MSKQKPPIIAVDQLAPFQRAGLTLMPLRKWTARTADGKPAGKLPLKGWRTNAYKAAAVIDSAKLHGNNVGVRIGDGWLVLDFDVRNAFGDDELQMACEAYGLDRDDCPEVHTGSGGRHLYLRITSGFKCRNTIPDFSAVECKAEGRFVVAPGSIHPNGKPYRWIAGRPPLASAPQAPQALLNAIARPTPAPDFAPDSARITPEQLARMLASVPPEDFSTNEKWEPLMMAAHHATGGAGGAEFAEWSAFDPAFADDGAQIETRWKSLDADKIGGRTFRTLNAIVAKYDPNATVAADAATDFEGDDAESDFDDEDAGDDSNALVAVEKQGLRLHPKTNIAFNDITNAYIAIHKSGLKPAWDELKQNIVFTCDELPWDASFGSVLTDQLVQLVRFYLVKKHQGVAYQPSEDNLRSAISTVAFAAKFNPVTVYLDALPIWDGVERVNKLFSLYFNCGHTEYTEAVSKCFMIGAVRRVRRPGSKFDTMPILESKQGWEKSTGIMTLFGSEWFSDADLGNLRDKDTVMKLRGIWAQEFAEFESLTRAEVGVLKSFTARRVDRQRDPYGHLVEDRPRRCVFIGTVNQGGYLQDPTGGRRFWPLKLLKRVDVAKLKADRDQLWAEASYRESKGESDVLPQHLWAVAGEHQKDQTNVHPWTDRIRDFLDQRTTEFDRLTGSDEEPSEGPLPPDKVHSSELFEYLHIPEDRQSRATAQRLREVMEQELGWQHRRGVRIGRRTRAGYTLGEAVSGTS